jgi:hypothetical protein
VGKITVHGGQAVREVADGVLLDRGCAPASSVKPFAAALGDDDVELEVVLIACPPAELPPARCRLEIGENLSPWIVAEGAQLTIPVPLPDLTGIHTAELQCEAGGQEMHPLTSTLYLTYAPPRPIVTPPQQAWYDKACSWGAGLGRNATEREVADQILHQLYRFGQSTWRYGTCTIQGSNCTLGTTTVPTEGLHCFPNDNLCKCPWTYLAAGDANRNFADCYIFSQTLQYIAATMGIGGMVPKQTFGSYQLGFVTHDTARSLDPKFTGNLLCGKPEAPCAYAFYNHDLRQWGELIYDPTFDGIYHQISELFSQSVTGSSDYSLMLEEGTACQQGQGYGGFPTYVKVPEGAPAQCGLLSVEQGESSARFGEMPPALGQQGNRIEVTFEVQILTEGTYMVSGKLFGKSSPPFNLPDGDTPPGVFPASFLELAGEGNDSSPMQTTTVSGKRGIQKVSLTFSGEDTGPYRLAVRLNQGATLLDKLVAVVGETPSPEPLDIHIPKNPAKLGKPSEVHLEWGGTDSDRVLQVTIPVNVRESAVYGIDARLSRGETTLAYGGGKYKLVNGTPLTVDFHFAELPAAGPCDLALSLHWLTPVSPLGGLMTKVQVPPFPSSARRR